ncbi:hypothetical protein DNL40_04560 [Xylanimonas oleitrophica]|uniref:Uncharacterized protein n=1 Tax=Xylanimonas oleitrophica TaxID=2607479 RepID=A0A2W5WUA6_9MICO|nr:hypothetical protein [Xylanimonas oleitrophica]PZR54203.1 hypothetical protein DNL40_04560 [Xylanimonas oleitrophica]
METPAAGLAALALFVLVLGFWVPQRVQHRQQLLDSRAEDRFSGGLRVLAVAADAGFRVPEAPALGRGPVMLLDVADGGPGAARPSSGLPQLPAGSGSGRGESSMVEPKAAEGRTPRLTVLELRAQRARRRLTLTLALLVASAAVWALAATTSLPWFAGLVPTALLVAVLVLGRVAAVQARKADARWEAERRAAQRRALEARALAAGGPRAPRNHVRVTGRAVHGSTALTQMIPRARVVDGKAEAPGSAPASRPTPRVQGTAEAARTEQPAEAPSSGTAEAQPAEPPAERATSTAPEPGAAWEPRPVPLPTYVTKPEAPRPEPKPISGTTPAVSTGWSTSPWQRVEDKGEDVAEATTSWSLGATQDAALGQTATPAPHRAATSLGEQGVAEAVIEALSADSEPYEPRVKTETLGLPLDQILARRRAAG